MNLDAFDAALREQGFVLVPDAVPESFLEILRQDIGKAYETCRVIQKKNGIDLAMDGTAHHLLGQADSFLDFFTVASIKPYLDRFFRGGKSIVNSYGGIINMKEKPSYVCNIHRDIRSFSGDTPLMLNLLVMVDDFTLENGATYLLAGSHLKPDKPEEKDFFNRADRATGKAGTLLFFNSNLWHAGGENKDGTDRRALTITFTPPYFKPGLDYPRALGLAACEAMPEDLKQLVGYHSRIPSSLEEWYQPPEKRFYKPGQG